MGYDTNLFGKPHIDEYQENSHKHRGLTYDYDWEGDIWQPSRLEPGQALRRPTPLFRKLDEEIVEQELSRLG